MIRLGIVGSRRRHTEEVRENIRYHIFLLQPNEIVSGGCPRGADRLTEEVAAEFGMIPKIFYPIFPWKELPVPEKWCQWCQYRKDQIKCPTCINNSKFYADYYVITQCNYARNRQIDDYSTHLLAFPAEDRKGGTEYTIKYWISKHGMKNLILQ